MNNLFTHTTGEIRYVVENGTFYYVHVDIARALGSSDGNLGGGFTDYLKAKYGDLRIKYDQKGRAMRPLTAEDVKEYYSSGRKGYRTRIAFALYDWLQEQEERARNGVPCVPAPIATEQPTEQPTESNNCLSKFNTVFNAFASKVNGEIEERRQMLEAWNGLREGALKYKEMYQRLEAQNADLQLEVDELKALNADLQAQVDALSKSQDDISLVSTLRQELAESRTLLGAKVLKEYFIRHYEENGIAIKRQSLYEPTEVVCLLKSIGIYNGTLTAESLNRYLMERGYQSKNAAKEHNPKAAAYMIADFLGNDYAIEQHVHKENNQDFNQLQWTYKGLALIVGTMQTVPPALTIDNIHIAPTFTLGVRS